METSATALVVVSRRWPGFRRPPRSAFFDGRDGNSLRVHLVAPAHADATTWGVIRSPQRAAFSVMYDNFHERPDLLDVACLLSLRSSRGPLRHLHAGPSYGEHGTIDCGQKHFLAGSRKILRRPQVPRPQSSFEIMGPIDACGSETAPAMRTKPKFFLRAAGSWPISMSRHGNSGPSARAATGRNISEKRHADRLDAATNGRRATKEDHHAA